MDNNTINYFITEATKALDRANKNKNTEDIKKYTEIIQILQGYLNK